MRLPVNHALPLAALILLGSGGAFAASRSPQAVAPATGPAADYPVVVGEPFTIGSTVWTPTDQLNYDAVGNAVTGQGEGVTAAHKTLPLPCYVEVTSLGTGRTILVRIERRGPMSNDALIELSPQASAQMALPAGVKAAVRVRRVNPPEQERAMLRAGNRAPERMETPEGLLKVLRRKLAEQSPLLPPPSTPPAMPSGQPPAIASAPKAAPPAVTAPTRTTPAPKPAATSVVAPAPEAPAPKPPAPKPEASRPAEKGSTYVQVAAFSSEASARKVAAQLGGTVSAAGKFWRVRLGPYANRAKAAPALEKARSAGYRDARILGAD
ncbi:SPOR domain-containing protein [Novosphingobium guangzhouense]|uniref:Sporulation protein SsgA n=1 Tax=Novosphingobium guangzhouense TaxID=1850347 RepID=A0A2K2G1A5_9SPHN|nr:SPOR domain-containing protein [Novosphingobium guangzhouense]PNU04823.1 sporulation protein SsgA [Novosphingobium guangzhouense]